MFAATAPLNLAQDRRNSIEERSILTWGANANRQCLSDDARVVPAPKHVAFLRPLRSLAAGWEGSLLIDADGSLWGGGSNRGQCLSEELSAFVESVILWIFPSVHHGSSAMGNPRGKVP